MATFTLRVGHIAPVFLALLMLSTVHGLLEEPAGCGRFQFQERVLEKMVVLDHTMKVTLSDLETKLTKYEHENTKLKEDLLQVQTQFEAKVEKSNEALVEELNTLRANYKQVTSAQSVQQQQLVFGFEAINKNVSEEMNILVDKMKQETAKGGGGVAHDPVAFNAYLSSADTNPTVGQPIIFNKEVQNYAHAYNTADGMFTPPTAGVYHFSVQICMSQKDRVAVQLVSANRIYAASTFQEEYDATCYSMTTAAVLEMGEKLWVKCIESTDNAGSERALEGDTPTKFRTMFNGLLVQPIA